MSASTTFKPSIRDAGELTDQRLFGSFRSLNRFEAPIHKSKHEDIFKSKEFEAALIPIAPKISNESSEDKQLKKEREKSRRSKRGEDGKKHGKNRHKKEEKEDQAKKDEEFLKYIGERHERRRKKNTHEENQENRQETPVRINSSKERPQAEENVDKNTKSKQDRLKFIMKTNAFSTHESKSDDSDSDNNILNNKDEIKVDIQKQINKQETIKVNQEFDYFKSIKNFNTIDFLLTPAPQGQTINCKILCRRGLISEYQFFLEQSDCANILLMKTQRKMTSAKASHLINIINYNESGQKLTNEITCAKISSNMARKKFKLNVDNTAFPLIEANVLNVIFKSNSGEPRKVMSTACLCSGTNGNRDKVTYFLKNRQPHYDINMRKFVLNYNGRAKQSSKNNFQIVDESFPDEILMQLGKVETGEYNCDFTWPLCAMQAFGLALSSLSR